MTANYYEILGIPEGSSAAEIKKAYRKKAKELHPDRNRQADAHERFILLSEAYEYALGLRRNRRNNSPAFNQEEWNVHKREEARQRAREHSKMRYEEYLKTDFYKNTQAIFVIWDHFYLLSALLLIVAAPTYGYYSKGGAGLAIGIVMVVLTAHYWAGIFTEKHDVNIRSLRQAFSLLWKTQEFHYVLLTALNLFLLVRFTLNTEISTGLFFCAFAFFMGLSHFLYTRLKSRLKMVTRSFFIFCVMPYLFNLFFLFNFIFSSSPIRESYYFNRDNSGYIYLQNNRYDDNPWFRAFFDMGFIRDANRITYRFEHGLFGPRVLKSYEFSKVLNEE